MTAIAVFGIAYDSEGNGFESWRTGDVRDYIEVATPQQAMVHGDAGFYKAFTRAVVDVQAAGHARLAGSRETPVFSHWLYHSGPGGDLVHWADRELHLSPGQLGWTFACFGVKRPRISWPDPEILTRVASIFPTE